MIALLSNKWTEIKWTRSVTYSLPRYHSKRKNVLTQEPTILHIHSLSHFVTLLLNGLLTKSHSHSFTYLINHSITQTLTYWLNPEWVAPMPVPRTARDIHKHIQPALLILHSLKASARLHGIMYIFDLFPPLCIPPVYWINYASRPNQNMTEYDLELAS